MTVPSGQTNASFTINTQAVTTTILSTVSATYANTTKNAFLTVTAAGGGPDLALTLNPAQPIVGSTATGTVTLGTPVPGGAVVTLTTDDPYQLYAKIPASVTIAPNATSANFTITTSQADLPGRVMITASYNGLSATATLVSVRPTVTSVSIHPAVVIGGNTATGTITLNGTVLQDTTIHVVSDQPYLGVVPSTVTVPAGQSSATFAINTVLVAAPTPVTITANALATARVSGTFTIDLTNLGRQWVLNQVTFSDGGTASGYFTYDADTGTYLDVNIATTPGNDPNSPLGKDGATPYFYPLTPVNSTSIADGTSASQLFVTLTVVPATSLDPSWATMRLVFAQALTNAGGEIPLVTDPNASFTPFCTGVYPFECVVPPANISYEYFSKPFRMPGYSYRIVTGGSVVAQ